MFVISKCVALIIEPLNFCILLILLGLVLRLTRWRHGAARLCVGAGMGCLITLGGVPGGTWLLAFLENRFPVPHHDLDHVDGVIVLGGSIDAFRSRERGRIALHESAERVTELVALAKRYPDARLVFSGGNGSLDRELPSESAEAQRFFTEMGVDLARMIFEEESRNTYENALFSFGKVRPRPTEKWLLITSAFHMPRAVGCFRKTGWPEVLPWPVDHLNALSPPWFSSSALANFSAWTLALREYTGLVAYRLMGRTHDVIPAPNPTL
jgi:uncharacterized SAM-binding protein YcdF (DUF218 family)